MLKHQEYYDSTHLLLYNKNIVMQHTNIKDFDYTTTYFNHYRNLENTVMDLKITNERIKLVKKYSSDIVCDFGIGCGSFISKMKKNIFGYDINPIGINWLKENKIYINPYCDDHNHIKCWTLWDVLEHLKNPFDFLKIINPNDFLFLSIPIFNSFSNLSKNKHFKPNEHLFYYKEEGLIKLCKNMNFILLESDNIETELGRENIKRYVFQKKEK